MNFATMVTTHMASSCNVDVTRVYLLGSVVVLWGLHANAAEVRKWESDVILADTGCPVTCLTGTCDDVTGNCIMDWGSGRDDPPLVTRIGCPKGFYSADCTSVCPANCANSTCEQDTGHCTEGCQTGYTGSDCSEDCPDGFHGDECLEACPQNCQNSTCSPQSGVCSDGCVAGFWGSDCSLGVELSRNTPEERRTFYKHLSVESKSVLLYVLSSRYEHALARAQFEIERAVQDRNDIENLLND